MKKIILLWLIVVSCFISCGSFADKGPVKKDIFSFKQEIGLTDEQESKLKAVVYDLQQTLAPNQKKMDALNADFLRMIKDKADIKVIRKKLEEITKIQVDSTCIDIENSRKIEGVLSPEQLKKWNAIKERESKGIKT